MIGQQTATRRPAATFVMWAGDPFDEVVSGSVEDFTRVVIGKYPFT